MDKISTGLLVEYVSVPSSENYNSSHCGYNLFCVKKILGSKSDWFIMD